MHLPMVAGIVLAALGMKKTLGDIGEPLKLVVAVAMMSGAALYLLAHVAFRLRNVHSLSKPRLTSAALCLMLIPVATELPALATLSILATLMVGLVAFETLRYAKARDRIRHQLSEEVVAN